MILPGRDNEQRLYKKSYRRCLFALSRFLSPVGPVRMLPAYKLKKSLPSTRKRGICDLLIYYFWASR